MKDSDLEAVNRRQAELIAELETARDTANAASAAKSNFLGVISHELRTPMNGVLGAAQLLQMSELSDRQKEFVGVIRDSGEGLMVLLNDILDITKIESGKMELDFIDVEAESLAARLTGPFKAQAEARGLTFTTEIRGPLPPLIRMDPLRLAQVTHNLLANAIKFTPQGEVRLIIDSEPAGDGRTTLRLDVVDSGIGIAADDLTRLFQPFSQVDGSSTRKFGGTGLGLSICQRLAALMDGEITGRRPPARDRPSPCTRPSTRLRSRLFASPPNQSRSSSLTPVLARVCASTRLTMTAQYNDGPPLGSGSDPGTTTE